MLDAFVKTYADRLYRYPAVVRHNGSVVAFAMDEDRRILYSVLDTTVAAARDADRWLESPRVLPFPREIADVGFAVADQVELPLVRKGQTAPVAPGTAVADADVDPVLSTTARFTADAPFQVLSDGAFVYVFRQSVAAGDDPAPLVDSNLLCDRFVLVGTELQPKREVRYRRSRSRTRPQSSKDSLGATDLENRPFVEPTQALKFVSHVADGRFSVSLLPTQVAEVWRWQIFVDNEPAALVDSYNLGRSDDGLFDTRTGSPATGAPGGFAGAALSFAHDGDLIDFGAGIALGSAFTIEAWLKPEPDAGDADVPLLTADAADGSPAHAGPFLSIAAGTRVHFGFGDGSSAIRDTVSGELLRPGAWNHLAVSFDGTYVRVYVDGVLRHRSDELKGLTPPATPVTKVGAASGGYRGLIDEMRFWTAVRPAAVIAEAAVTRLTGLEPDLACYLRLDDGAGDTAWDSSAGGTARGGVTGATWVSSDAPIAEGTGLTRSSFRVYPRIVTSGISSLLYFQQEKVPTGYDGEPKPLKRAARVLLAMATYDGNPDQRHEVVCLDFGVSLDGRLAQVPTELVLPTLEKPSDPGTSLDAKLQQLVELEGQIPGLRTQVDAASIAAREVAVLDQVLDGGASWWQLDLTGLPQELANEILFASLAPSLQPFLDADALRRDLSATREQARPTAVSLPQLQTQLADATTAFQQLELEVAGGLQLPMPLVHLDPSGLTLAGAVLGFAASPDTPLLFDSALGTVALYFRGDGDAFLAVSYDTLTDRARLALPAGSGVVALTARAANLAAGDDGSDSITVSCDCADADETCTLTITAAGPTAPITETWRLVPRDPAELADVVNGTAATPVFAGLAGAVTGSVTKLPVPAGTKTSLRSGALLQIGDDVLVLAADAPAGATQLQVAATEVTANAGTSISATRYDYAANAQTTQVPATLAGGSLVVRASADGASGNVQAGDATYVAPTAACRFFAPAPGGALHLDGRTGIARLAAADELDGLAPAGDLTVETWVKPAAGGGFGRIVDHHSDRGDYALALRPQPAALHFDGAHDGVIVPTSSALQFAGPVTLEAWVQPQATDGVRDIVGHGPRRNPNGEVFLRIANGTYQVGSWDGDTHYAGAPIPAGDVGSWVHLAGVYDGTSWLLYRNGVQIAAAPSTVGAVSVGAGWGIGTSASGADLYFAGGIDEVRIWNRARSADEIDADRGHRLTGSEPGLVGYWRPGLASVFHYVDAPGAPAHVQGNPVATAGPFPSFTVVASVGGRTLESRETVPSDRWTHLAAVHHQAYGIALQGADSYVDCGSGETLDLSGDLTLEVGVRVDSLAGVQGLVGRGSFTGDGMPYALAVGSDGRLIFSWVDASGQPQARRSTGTIAAGDFHHLAVTRKRSTVVDPATGTDPTKLDASKLVHNWQDIAFFVDGQPAGGARIDGGDALGSGAPTRLGQALVGDLTGSGPFGLHGVLSEVRVWSVARAQGSLGGDIAGTESGLVSWWRFAENSGTTTADAKGSSTATLHGSAQWVESPDDGASKLVVYADTEPLTLGAPAAALASSEPQFAVGGLGNATAAELFSGELAELRIWSTARTQEQIEDNLFRRLTGELEDLLAYYRFDFEALGQITDLGLRGHSLESTPGATVVVATAPLGGDIPEVRDALVGVPTDFNETIAGTAAVGEYAELETDALGNLGGAMKRCYALVRDGRWLIVSGFKVGDVVAEWVGQAQFAPQLVGFIEGAPPVPSENLTVQDSYDDASSVVLTEAESTTYTYASTRDTGFDVSVEASAAIGSAEKVDVGFGVLTQAVAEKINVGIKTSFENSLGWLDEASTGSGLTLTRMSTLGLRGAKEDVPEHKKLGPRYVPENTGLALVQSDTADVFALRLAHTGALVAYQMRPNPDIPKDWNILTFPIDPHYTKQGTLDGHVGDEPDRDYPNSTGYSSDRSYFKPVEAYGLKRTIDQAEQRLRTLFDQYDAGMVGRRQAGTQFGPTDLAAGRLTDKLPRFEKRNLVNTYVWTAAGGLFSEEEQTLDQVHEQTGGSFAFKGLAGLTANIELAIGGAAIDAELTALLGGHLNLTVTKSVDSQTSFAVASQATPEATIGERNAKGQLVRTPGKVDAYRYMTFYLEPLSDNYDAFFGSVVDPIWLQQSSDPNAAALREAAQPGKRPACWRVLHRVTFVSRVLAAVPAVPGQEPTLDTALQSLDIDSNYELVRALDPYLRDKATRYGEFVAAAQAAVRAHLPALVPHLDEVLSFLVLYYGVTDSPVLSPPEDLSQLVPPPPAVHAGPSGSFAAGQAVALVGSAIDEHVETPALTLQWSKRSGPGAVRFAKPHALSTRATFSKPGVYVLRLSASNGSQTGFADTTLTITGAPVAATKVPHAARA